MSVCSEEMKKIRKMLNAPTREQLIWEQMTRPERKTMIRHAGVKANEDYRWPQLSEYKQRKIMQSVKRASEWAGKLNG